MTGSVDGDLWAEHFSRYVFAEPFVRGRRLLDLGTGVGYGAQHLSRLARSAVGVDVSREALAHAREHHAAPNLSYAVGDAHALPFADGSFDVVVAFEVIEHVRDARALVAEVRRVLAPDGVFLVSTPNRAYYTEDRGEQNPFHVREFEIPELLDLLRPTFPETRVYLQSHAPAVVIAPPPAEQPRQLVARMVAADGAAEGDDPLRTAHYAVVVCGAAPAAEAVAFLPEGSGNVLRTREQHLRSVLSDLGKALGELGQLRKEFDDRTAWALRLDAALQKAEGELARIRNTPLRRTVRLAGRLTLPYLAAGCAVPLAACVGVGAFALEGVARLLPPHRAPPTLVPVRNGLATLLILNYDGKDLLARNLPHVQAAVAHTGQPHQILVVDNGSSDGSVEFVRERFPDVDVVPLPENCFFSAGNNRGIPHARHDVVVLLNNDMRVEPDFLPPLLRPFEGDASVFAVASHIEMPGRQEETGNTRGRFSGGRMLLRHDPLPPRAKERLLPILWGGGGACAFDKRKFLALGGLDVLYDPFYCEDADLSLRAWMRGWKVLLAPASKVWHEHRTTSRRVFGEKFVEETVRRNLLLLHWANLREPRLLAAHLAALPWRAYAEVRRDGVGGVRSLARAGARAPRALLRRLREREPGPPLSRVLQRTEVGLDPTRERPPRAPRAGEPLRITMVTPYHLYPVQPGGAVRMYSVARELARRGHDVSVVGFVDTEEQREAGARHLAEFCGDVRLLVRTPDHSWRPAVPNDVRQFDQLVLRRELAENFAARDPDVLQIEYMHMAPYAALAEGRLTCITEHDVAFVSRYRHAIAERGGLVMAAKRYAAYLRTFRYELEALRRFDVVFTVSQHDATLLRSYLGPGVHVSDRVPIGVDVAGTRHAVRRPDPATLLFVGSFAHTPNVDAMAYFTEEILPALHARAPEVRVLIAGGDPPEFVRAAAEDPRVEVLGFVPDLEPLYARATAVVLPIRVAAGVRVKLLEAFAARVPVVSTRAGAEGVTVASEKHLLLADSAREFVDQTLRLVSDRQLGERLAAHARRSVEERYSWTAIVDALEDEYRSGLHRKLAGGAHA